MASRFQPKCGCLQHDDLSEESSFELLKISNSRKVQSSIVSHLRQNNLLKKKATYICDICVKKHSLNSSNVSIVVNKIRNNQLKETELEELASAIGTSQHSNIKQISTNIPSDPDNLDVLWGFKQMPPVVSGFLSGVVGGCDSEYNKRYMAAAFECLLAACSTNVITPLFFVINLVTYFITGSKAVCNILSSFLPSGAYCTVLRWMEKNARDKILCCPKGDVLTFFDNNQILARNWKVRYNSKAMISVITTLIHIFPKQLSFFQEDINLSPRSWLYNYSKSIHGIISDIFTLIQSSSVIFNSYRDNFINQTIQKVYDELKSDRDVVREVVNGNDQFDLPTTKGDPYAHVQHTNCDPPNIVLGEPYMKNPCSYESVTSVLQHIVNETVGNSDRKWTIIGCDGLPFLLGSRLIQKHDELQNILLQPGLGHYEINMTKACFKLFWDVALSDLGKMLGFNSIKAQLCCQKATDHHKAWQILCIFLYGSADELVYPYVKLCMEMDELPTLSGFYSWCREIEDPRFLFMKDAIFTYVFALFLFRSAVRRNNSEVMVAARTKFSALFYGLNMTSYQEIDYLDLKRRILSPNPIKFFMEQHEAFSISGHPSRGEGGDFILEGRNRRTKRFIPSGLPTEQRWLRVCRNLDKLGAIRDNLIKEEEMDMEPCFPNLNEEIIHWRAKLRGTLYLSADNTQKNLVSLSGQVLDNELVNFAQHCKGNRELYLEDIGNGCVAGKGDQLTPVFILKADREKFQSLVSKTKAKIQSLILEDISQIRQLGYEEQAEALEKRWSKVRLLTKDAYLLFYRGEVLVALDDASQSGTYFFNNIFLSS